MALDDLDLEFEDEEEANKKKSDVVQVDVDLEFTTPEVTSRDPRSSYRPGQVSTPASIPIPRSQVPPAQPNQVPPGIVKKLDDARSQPSKRPVPPAASGAAAASPGRVVGSSALKEVPDFDMGSQEIIELREQVRRLEFEAEVKVGIAEFKMELLGELMGDIKLMEHQVGQLLVRINAKHPDLKQEAMMIKKILADFSGKKRK